MSETGLPLWDICAARHRGSATSKDANKRTNKSQDMQTILDFIRTRHGEQSWLKEIERETGIIRNTVSARLSDLKASEDIYETGERAEKCAIVRIRQTK